MEEKTSLRVYFKFSHFKPLSNKENSFLKTEFIVDLRQTNFGKELINILQHPKYNRFIKYSFFLREGSNDEFIVFLKCYSDDICIKLGLTKYGFPRGFPFY